MSEPTRNLPIRFDADEYDALQALASAESVPLSEFCRQAIRLGVAASELAATQNVDEERRAVDRDLTRKSLVLVTQCALILHDLAEKNGVDTADTRATAYEIVGKQFAESDGLEQAIAELKAGRA